ncbi:MAG: glycosyltransferase [Planctomycetota bacterium]|nr:glycosyltransferase [Planctomycetota bacterium]
MNVLMMTNTYLPHVGGVARSVESFAEALREMGHAVLIVAPTFPKMPESEEGVIRVPAVQHFNGSDFSVRLPIPGLLSGELDRFEPELVHAHHPFLLGDTALRVSVGRDLPLVFTHHTMYERYTQYVPGDSPAMQRFAARLATEYARLCDHVIAPSESVARILRQRGVETPISDVPTGIDLQRYASGDGAPICSRWGIPDDAFVVGCVSRLAPEKNLAYLAGAVARLLRQRRGAHFLVVGDGPSASEIKAVREERGVTERVHLTGSLLGTELADAYHAMDVFAFASQTETQGMVLAEAMSAGTPVVALDAPGAREVVRDRDNGRLLAGTADEGEFADALEDIAARPADERRTLSEQARRTAESFSMPRCARALDRIYRRVRDRRRNARAGDRPAVDETPWARTRRILENEWRLWSCRAEAAAESIIEEIDGSDADDLAG